MAYTSRRDIITGINLIRTTLEDRLSTLLHLTKVPGPLYVPSDSHLNDRLSGIERPVTFDPPHVSGTMEIVQSLAKWKRMALREYGFQEGEGIYVDMRAIRQDEVPDRTHSLLVDQWDWEVPITKGDRNIAYLMATVRDIYSAIVYTERIVPNGVPILPDDIHFIGTEDLESLYPDVTPKDRESIICRDKGAVCIIGIGYRHDSRSWEYDDWDLNCDILVWNPILGEAMELSSMGIRVDAHALHMQCPDTIPNTPYHNGILDGTLPYTIGGGIGQSRMYMFLLGLKHIEDAHLYQP